VSFKLDLNIRVADVDASCVWYEQIFGEPPLFRGEDRTVDGKATTMVCFRIGGVKLWILPAKGAIPAGNQRVGIALMTREPLAPVRRELAGRGVTFDDTPMLGFPIDDDGIRQGKDAEFFYILDPDGHRIEFCRAFG
jgi:catechol 2,3-dioxygenase-like lactoylglutathione lyase family enzyme